MTAPGPCSLCGSTRARRTSRAGAVYCENHAGCQRRRHPRPAWTHTGTGAARANADHRIVRNGTAQLSPRCLACGGAIVPREP